MAQHKILTPVIKPMMFVAPRGVAADALAPPPPGVELEALMPSLGGGGGYSYSPRRGADTNLLNDDQRAYARVEQLGRRERRGQRGWVAVCFYRFFFFRANCQLGAGHDFRWAAPTRGCCPSVAMLVDNKK